MSQEADVQWCDSTVNPIVGCAGCELYVSPASILSDIDWAVEGLYRVLQQRAMCKSIRTTVYLNNSGALLAYLRRTNRSVGLNASNELRLYNLGIGVGASSFTWVPFLYFQEQRWGCRLRFKIGMCDLKIGVVNWIQIFISL